MIKACDIFKKRHLPCYAHTLNLAVQDALKLKDIKAILDRCKDIVKWFKSSTKANAILKQEQQALHKLFYKLIQEVPTRWNSCYDMIKRILQVTDPVNTALLKLRNAPLPLSVDETTILEDIKNVLSCFEEATTKVSGANYVTISLIIPLSYGIYNYLIDLCPNLKSKEGKIICKNLIQSVRNILK